MTLLSWTSSGRHAGRWHSSTASASEEVWKTVTVDLPRLIAQLGPLAPKPEEMTKHTKGRARAAQADTTLAAAPARKTEVKITAAKGRPMLVWVGKRPLAQVTAFPAQHVETFDPSGALGRKSVDTQQLEGLAGDVPERRALVPRRQQRSGRASARQRLPRQGQSHLHRPAIRLRCRLRPQSVSARREGHRQDRRRRLHARRADPVHRHLGERQLPAVHVRTPPAAERTPCREGVYSCPVRPPKEPPPSGAHGRGVRGGQLPKRDCQPQGH